MRRISAAAFSATLVIISLAAVGTGSATAAPSRVHDEHLGAAPAHLSALTRTAPRLGATSVSGPPSVGIETSLPLPGFGDVVADPSHGHVFVSSGEGHDGVTVLSTIGTVKRTLSGLPGASGMVLSADGSTVYVALFNGDAIGEIDTATLAVTTLPTGADTCPSSVAQTAGSLWFGYGCYGASGSVGTMEPDGTVHPGVITGLGSAPQLTTSPALDGVLFTGEGLLAKYLVTGGGTPSATREHYVSITNLGDMAITPDGTEVVVAAGWPYYQQRFATSDLSVAGQYTTSNYPDAVAINADGQVAAGINGTPDVWLFQPGGSTATRTYSLRGSLVPGGLAFAGSHIYAVTNTSGPYDELHVVSTLPDATVKVTTDKSTYKYAAKAHVKVRVPGAPNSSTVSVYAKLANGAHGLVKSGHPTAGVFTAALHVGLRTTFTATYSGDDTHGPTTSKGVTVKVHGLVVDKVFGKYATSHHVALFHVRKDPRIGAAMAPGHAGQCLYFVAQKPVGGHWRTVGKTGCVVMNSDSAAGAIFSGTHRVGERVRFRAEWHGDKVNLADDGPWLDVRFTR